MSVLVSSRTLDWTLRVGAFMCFIGHGAFGLMTKSSWVPYFYVVGIGPEVADKLMPLIGVLDIVLGCTILLSPRPIVAGWMVVWALWTASLRPLAGESVWEAVERAGNYGVPAALLVLMAPRETWLDLFRKARQATMTPLVLARTRRVLVLSVVMLLVGHGALAALGKHTIVANVASVVQPELAPRVTEYLGWLEIVLAVAVLLRPFPVLLLGIAVWKVLSESLYVAAGASTFEVIERGGSYAAPIALAIVMALLNAGTNTKGRIRRPGPSHYSDGA